MPNYQLTTTQWLSLKPETKAKLKEIFTIPKSAGVQFIQDGGGGRLISDGHTHADLAHITLEKMAQYLGEPVSGDFYGTFDKVLDKIEGRVSASEPVSEPQSEPEKKRMGRPPKRTIETLNEQTA